MGSWQGHELVKNKRMVKQMKRERADVGKGAPAVERRPGWKRNPPKARVGSSNPVKEKNS